MTDGVHNGDHGGVRRRTVLTTALGAVPVVMAGGIGTASAAPLNDDRSVTGLTVEHRADPLGVDARRPRFGWRTASPARGSHQTAYRVRVTRGGAQVWDTGRVPSSDAVAVR